MQKVRVCFVCLGNICRSPTAEGVFLHLVSREGLTHRFVVDSAGTGDWHTGELPHPDTRAEARRRGIELTSRARQLTHEDFERFDYIVAMDAGNRQNILRMAATDEHRAKVHMFRSFDPASAPDDEVPDPYYEGGFDAVFDICEAAARGLLSTLRDRHGLR